jgi:hypothetical protein
MRVSPTGHPIGVPLRGVHLTDMYLRGVQLS